MVPRDAPAIKVGLYRIVNKVRTCTLYTAAVKPSFSSTGMQAFHEHTLVPYFLACRLRRLKGMEVSPNST